MLCFGAAQVRTLCLLLTQATGRSGEIPLTLYPRSGVGILVRLVQLMDTHEQQYIGHWTLSQKVPGGHQCFCWIFVSYRPKISFGIVQPGRQAAPAKCYRHKIQWWAHREPQYPIEESHVNGGRDCGGGEVGSWGLKDGGLLGNYHPSATLALISVLYRVHVFVSTHTLCPCSRAGAYPIPIVLMMEPFSSGSTHKVKREYKILFAFGFHNVVY